MGKYLVPSVSTAFLSVEFSCSFQGPFRHRLSNFAHRFRQSLLLRPGSLLATSTQLTTLKDRQVYCLNRETGLLTTIKRTD